MIMNRYRIIAFLVACHLSIGITHAQQNEDSIIVYNDKRPLIYEDAWDLWPYAFLNEEGKPIGSVLVMDFASRDQLKEYLENEPYIQEKVWEDVKVEPMNVVIVNGEKVGK